MSANDDKKIRIYSEAWLSLGVVSPAEVENHQLELVVGDDPHPEHFRWRSFVRFVHRLRSLSPSLARSLYTLGDLDPDVTLSESIRSVILRHDDCPRDLFDRALQNGTEHLIRVAKARIASLNA